MAAAMVGKPWLRTIASTRTNRCVFPPVDELLPHRPPARLVDAIEAETEDGLVCRTSVGRGWPFVHNGAVDILVAVELVAQAAGCMGGLSDRRDGKPPSPRMLVGIRRASFAPGAVLRPGDALSISVRRANARGPVASFIGRVLRGEEELADVEVLVARGELPRQAAVR